MTMGTKVRRAGWAALLAAACAAAIVTAEAASIGGVLVWAGVGLLRLPSAVGIAGGALVAVGSIAAGWWMFRAAYAVEREPIG